MNSGPQKAYMPLHAIPKAVPHMELPLYQKEYAGMANRPEMAKMSSAGLVMAAPSNLGTLPIPPPIIARTGNAISSSSKPAVT